MTAMPELQLQAAAAQPALGGGSAWRRRIGIIAIVVRGALALLVAMLGPLFAPHSVSEIVGVPFAGPGSGTPLGTDYLGHDVLSRVLHGGRSLVLLPLVATLAVSGIGTVIGIVSGHLAGRVDRAVMAVLDVLLALPWLLVMLVWVSGWGAAPSVLVCAVVLTGSPFIARVARGDAAGDSRQRPGTDPWGVVTLAVLTGALAVSANLLVDRLARRLTK
jgi:ABC-type dipeptide/oligopeptide/nickel transport system permease subunit